MNLAIVITRGITIVSVVLRSRKWAKSSTIEAIVKGGIPVDVSSAWCSHLPDPAAAEEHGQVAVLADLEDGPEAAGRRGFGHLDGAGDLERVGRDPEDGAEGEQAAVASVTTAPSMPARASSTVGRGR